MNGVIQFELICGVGIGIEYVDEDSALEEGEWGFIIELGIFRVVAIFGGE